MSDNNLLHTKCLRLFDQSNAPNTLQHYLPRFGYFIGILEYSGNYPLNDDGFIAVFRISGENVKDPSYPEPNEALGEYERITHNGKNLIIKNLKFYRSTIEHDFCYYLEIYHHGELVLRTCYFNVKPQITTEPNRNRRSSQEQIPPSDRSSSTSLSPGDSLIQSCESSNTGRPSSADLSYSFEKEESCAVFLAQTGSSSNVAIPTQEEAHEENIETFAHRFDESSDNSRHSSELNENDHHQQNRKRSRNWSENEDASPLKKQKRHN